ncbi:MAG: glycoside hydrolase family 20 zincin-like fold domain-containing protein [Armatimonadota bacterium]
MVKRSLIFVMSALVACAGAHAEVFVGPQAPQGSVGIVQNPSFEDGGMSYADHWRPLPGGLRMHRVTRETGEHSLFLQLRKDGDAGVMQTVRLPARRSLSLRVLATCHADADCAVVATLVRRADGRVLAEVVVDGIERGVLAEGFDTGRGGPADLMVRVVGEAGGRALIDRVTIARPVAARHARRPDFSGADLLLAQGEGLRVDADFEPRLLPQAAEMLQEAIEDMTGAPITSVGAAVRVSVDEPRASEWPERESYRLTVNESGATISAPAEQGAMWGMMTLIDLLRPEPGGGARVVAVDVRDEPALPWRIGMMRPGEGAANAARTLARLKLNMALLPRDATGGGADEGAAASLRELGVEPVVVVSGDSDGGVEGAMRDATDRLNARYLFVSPPMTDSPTPGAALPWSEAPLSAVARLASGDVTVMAPAAARTRDEAGGVDGVPISLDGWPQDVVAVIHPSSNADQALGRLAELDAAGVRSVVYHFDGVDGVSRALTARAHGVDCMGALISENVPSDADRAWRGFAFEG